MSHRAHGTPDRAGGDPPSKGRRPIGAHPLAGLQRSAGNRAVQRLVSDDVSAVDGDAISARIGAAEGSGRALDESTRGRLTEALGADPGDVRIHADSDGHDLSQSLGAKAFTSGRDIFFQAGTFDPGTAEGFELLVHESTHVLQQASGPVAGTATADGALAISDPGDSFEQAASSKAEGTSAPASGSDGRSVQREEEALRARPVQRMSFDDLTSYIPQSGPGPLSGMIDTGAKAVGEDSDAGQLGTGTLTKWANAEKAREAKRGADLREGEKKGEGYVDDVAKYGGAPGRFAGGMIKEVAGIGTGLASMAENPIGFIENQGKQASQGAMPMAIDQTSKSYDKVKKHEEGVGDAAWDIFGAFSKGHENELMAKGAAAKPMAEDIRKGDYASAAGRFGAEIGIAVLGMGETGPAGEVAAEADAAAAEEGAARQPLAPNYDTPIDRGELPAPNAPAPEVVPEGPPVPDYDTPIDRGEGPAPKPDYDTPFDTPEEKAPDTTPEERAPDTTPEEPLPRFPMPDEEPLPQPDYETELDDPAPATTPEERAPDTIVPDSGDAPTKPPVDMRSPKAESVVPQGEPVVEEPEPISEAPATPTPEDLEQMQDDYDKGMKRNLTPEGPVAPAEGPPPPDFGPPTPLDDPSFVDPEPASDPVGLPQEDPEDIRKRLWG